MTHKRIPRTYFWRQSLLRSVSRHITEIINPLMLEIYMVGNIFKQKYSLSGYVSITRIGN